MHTLNINGQQTTDIKEIFNYEVQFYKNLYSSDNIDDFNINEYLNNTIFEKTLTKQDASTCDGPLTLDEVTTAVFGMKKNKSPGLSAIEF